MGAENGGQLRATNLAPNNGTLRAGAGGLLTVTGDFTQLVSGAVIVELGGLATSQFGRVAVTGTATFAGTLDIDLVDGFVPVLSDRFQFMTFASRVGLFDTVLDAILGPGLVLTLDDTDASDLELVAAEPGTPGDTDGDGLSDEDEVNVYLTDPLDADSDDDGLDDGVEVNLLGTDPNNEDTDGDLVCDGGIQVGVCTASGPDNCPFVSNFSQTNSDGLAAGDACQCGDVTGDGAVTAADVTRAQENLVGAALSGDFIPTRCNVIGLSDGGISDCDVADIFILQRFLAGSPVSVANACDAYSGP